MRFQRLPALEFTDSKQKRSAYLRKVKRIKEQYPLLDLVGELEFDDVDTEMTARQCAWNAATINEMKVRAMEWLTARKKMREHPRSAEIYAYWQSRKSAPVPVYLHDLIRNFERYYATWLEYQAKKASWNKL